MEHFLFDLEKVIEKRLLTASRGAGGKGVHRRGQE